MLTSFDPPELKAEGIELLRHAVSLWPTSAEARLSLASALYQAGDAEEAERTYREVLQQHPDDPRAMNDLAWILQEHSRRYDEALTLTNRALAVTSRTPGSASSDVYLLDTKGTILLKMPDRLAEARSTFEEILRVLTDPRRADPRRQARTCLQLGRIYLALSDPAQARRYLDTGLEVDRKHNVLTTEERAEIGRLIDEAIRQAAPPTETASFGG